MEDLRRVCVIGAGTMGGGIAAHLANLGFEVFLLDRTEEIAAEAFERTKRARPPHFYLPDTANQVQLGALDDHAEWISEADWVCEAIFEDMDAKRRLFAQIEPLLAPNAFITTNTSGLQISLLAKDRSPEFRRRFHGTHFFNPPRYLKLLELIPTDETDPAVIQRMADFLEEFCARRVVAAKDTPGFIANRFGMWAMFHAIHTAEKLGLTVEQVDAITGPFLGRPKSASFRLNDIVGLDIMASIADNLYSRCLDDPHRDTLLPPNSLMFLLGRGWVGDKAGQGYYRREGRELFAFDLGTQAYRQRAEVSFPSLAELQGKPLGERVAAALELRDEVGEFLREHLRPVLQYADYLKDKIAYSVLDFDRVMKWGFAWEAGPFELMDRIGADRLGIGGGPYYVDGRPKVFAPSPVRESNPDAFRTIEEYPLIDRRTWTNLRDLGDGILAVCITSKLGVLSPEVLAELTEVVSKLDSRFVLTTEGRMFSAGFDLKFCRDRIEAGDLLSIEEALKLLQNLTLLLSGKRAVAALHGHCLGAGLEVALGCARIAAAAETQIGFPEAKVGLLPAGSGCARAHLINQTSAKALADVAIRITMGFVAPNSDHARRIGYIRPEDATVYHPDRLIWQAKQIALNVEPYDWPEWRLPDGPIVGMIDRDQMELAAKGELTQYDETIGDHVKSVIAKSASLDEALDRERELFLGLCREGLTQARIRHMLENGKPLRN
jgi:3-hydroxyacyl-CoA dehydrogenase